MDIYLVTYDIRDDKRRNKIANLLQDYGQRVQYSVFEIWLDATGLKDVQTQLRHLLDEGEDNVRLYQLCALCRGRVQVIGAGDVPQPPRTIII